MPRAFVFVLDSVGIGGAPDAAAFNDEGSNTLGHIAQACDQGLGDREGLRQGPLTLPHLVEMGIAKAANSSVPGALREVDESDVAAWAIGREFSAGKDTPSGHWEIAELPVPQPWAHFPDTVPSFPDDLVASVILATGVPGILGNSHASGIPVINQFAEEHIRSGKPICYTSADSVFQIAAHEHHFGLDRLYNMCAKVFELTAPLRVGTDAPQHAVGNWFTRTTGVCGCHRAFVSDPFLFQS